MQRPSIESVRAQAQRLTTPCGVGNIVWHAWGSLDAPLGPLVVWHGGSGSWTHWLCNVQALAQAGYYVLAADLPGFGESAVPPDGGDADAMITPLHIGLKQLLSGRSFTLMGFSFGGMTAGLYAAEFPAKVSRLVIVGAPGLGLAARPFQGMKAWRHLNDAAQRREIHRFNLRTLMLAHDESVDDQAAEIQETNVPRDRLPGRRLAFTGALADALHKVTCPVHVIYGWEDALYQGRQDILEAKFRESSPSLQSFEFVPDAGHWVQYERPDAFNAVLLKTLNKESS